MPAPAMAYLFWGMTRSVAYTHHSIKHFVFDHVAAEMPELKTYRFGHFWTTDR